VADAAADVTHHHGGNCRFNSSPEGDAQEAHRRQSTAGWQSSSFVILIKLKLKRKQFNCSM